jgi:hypothetical protein
MKAAAVKPYLATAWNVQECVGSELSGHNNLRDARQVTFSDERKEKKVPQSEEQHLIMGELFERSFSDNKTALREVNKRHIAKGHHS